MMKLAPRIAALAMLMAVLPVAAQEQPAKSEAVGPEQQEKLIAGVEPALVIVEYTLQFDKGEAPTGAGFGAKCPNCGQYHGNGAGEVVKEERPQELAGYLIDEKKVLVQDPQTHPRFVKSIAVRRFDRSGKLTETVNAKVSAYAKNSNAVILELDAAMPGAKAPTFDATAKGGLSYVALQQNGGRWGAGVHSLGGSFNVLGNKKMVGGGLGIAVNKEGIVAGVVADGDLPADGSWKGSPLKWALLEAGEMEKTLKSTEALAQGTIVRVTLNFRSPRNKETNSYRGGGGEDSTVQHVLGLIVDKNRVVVLTELKPTVTARLERIRVFTEPPIDAKFAGSLTDFGAFVATLEKPAAASIELSGKAIEELVGVASPSATINLQGEKRVVYLQPRRIADLNKGWRRNLYPEVVGDSTGLFMFDSDGALAAFPMVKREKASTAERWGSDRAVFSPSTLLAPVLADLKSNIDTNNVPLSEEAENRLAWIGVELQGLNQELARANNVSDLTSDGDTGALVTLVHPDSPAGKAGVEAGWVLLRINAEGEPKPIEVKVEQEYGYGRTFPWDRLDQVSEEYFDQIPTPWPALETPLVRTLTDLGFGKKYTAEFFTDGKVVKKDFVVTEGPAHYFSAPKYKHVGLGITLRDMTYEVREYLKKKPDDVGVIISKIEKGSKGSTSGLKPYELITHVNDKPVKNVKDFEEVTKGQNEMRFTIKRMTRGRIVKVTLAAATTQGAATKAAGEGAVEAPAEPITK